MARTFVTCFIREGDRFFISIFSFYRSIIDEILLKIFLNIQSFLSKSYFAGVDNFAMNCTGSLVRVNIIYSETVQEYKTSIILKEVEDKIVI